MLMLSLAVAVSVAFALALGCPPEAAAHSDLEEQIAAVTARIDREPRRADLHLKRGDLHRAHRDWVPALADLDRAAALDPGLASVDLARATLSFDADMPRAALAAIERFLARQPDHAGGRILRARILTSLRRPLEAAEDWARAIAASARPRPEYYLARAHALAADDRRIDEALAALEDGTRRLGPIVTLELAAMELELARARYDAALARVDRLAAAAPRNEQWLVQRGEILERAGRAAEARDAFAAALKAVQTLPEARRRTRAVEDIETRSRSALEGPGETR